MIMSTKHLKMKNWQMADESDTIINNKVWEIFSEVVQKVSKEYDKLEQGGNKGHAIYDWDDGK